ncbi:MAG: hypothetical protein SF162_16850 [bacterium]|nr:hypothetical protein [bacterium]
MLNKPTYLRIPTEQDAPYFASASAAEIIVDRLMAAQRRGNLLLHAFVVLPNAVELIATPLGTDMIDIKDELQAHTAILLNILLPKAAQVWDRRFIVKWLDTQRALDLQLQVMACLPLEHALADQPTFYAYSWLHPRYKGCTSPYMRFMHAEAIATPETRIAEALSTALW